MNKKAIKDYARQIGIALDCMDSMTDENYKNAFGHTKEETARSWLKAIKGDFEKELNK